MQLDSERWSQVKFIFIEFENPSRDVQRHKTKEVNVNVASKCPEKVDQIQSVIDPFKLSSTVSKLTGLGFRRQSLVLQRS